MQRQTHDKSRNTSHNTLTKFFTIGESGNFPLKIFIDVTV